MIAAAEVSEKAVRALLDPQNIRELAARVPALADRELQAVEAKVLWVKPGRHFNAAYEVRCGGASRRRVLLSVFAVGAERARHTIEKLPRHRHAVADVRCPRCASACTDDGLLLQLFPFDYRLPALRDCFRLERAGAALATTGELVEIRRLAYRPGMRCLILYRFAGGARLFGKIAVEREAGRVYRQHQWIENAVARASTRQLRVARACGYDAALGLFTVGAAEGVSVDESLAPGCDEEEILGRVATALAEFHSLPVDGIERVYRAAEEVDLLRGWIEVVGTLFPELHEALRAALALLAARTPEEGGAPALAHRDFYEKQVLLSPAGATFLDLDTVCAAHAEIDLGNFCAHLRLRGHQTQDPAWGENLERRFLALYPRPFTSDRVDWYRRCALLRLVCVHRLRPGGAELAPALLAAAVAGVSGPRR